MTDTVETELIPRLGGRPGCGSRQLKDALSKGAALRATRGQTILIADDTADVRDLMGAVLAGAGYRVLCTSGGADALRLGERHDGKIDLLITDWEMPKMDGGVLARRLSARRPDMKILMVSGLPIPDDGDGKDFAFLQKPFRVAELTGAVAKALSL